MTEEKIEYQTTGSLEKRIEAAYNSGDVETLSDILKAEMEQNVKVMAENAKLKLELETSRKLQGLYALTLRRFDSELESLKLSESMMGGA